MPWKSRVCSDFSNILSLLNVAAMLRACESVCWPSIVIVSARSAFERKLEYSTFVSLILHQRQKGTHPYAIRNLALAASTSQISSTVIDPSRQQSRASWSDEPTTQGTRGRTLSWALDIVDQGTKPVAHQYEQCPCSECEQRSASATVNFGVD
jgi:hypothetical protein